MDDKDELTADEKAFLDRIFSYHAPDEGQPQKYRELRDKGRAFAECMMILARRNSPERVTGLRCIQEAVMWGNAAIARSYQQD